MRAIFYALAATVSTYAASPDIPVREVSRLTGVQSLSISDGFLRVASFLHQPSLAPSLRADAKLRSGETFFVAAIRHTRLTYTVIAVTPTEALIDVLDERSTFGFGTFDIRSSYGVRVVPYSCTPDEIDFLVHPGKFQFPIGYKF